MSSVYVEFSKSVLLLEAVTKIRDENTKSPAFRFNLERIGRYLAYEVSKSLESSKYSIRTPLQETIGHKLKYEVVVLSILRAALPMTNAVLSEFNEGALGVISASRGDMIGSEGKNFDIVSSYSKIPSIQSKYVIIVDPMLATGSTIKYLLELLKSSNEEPVEIFVLCAIASKHGITELETAHPNVKIYAAAVDETLNKNGYIVPGLGDAGDRAFNTQH